jgi:kumamolisin
MIPRLWRPCAATLIVLLTMADIAKSQSGTQDSLPLSPGRLIYPISSIPQEPPLTLKLNKFLQSAAAMVKFNTSPRTSNKPSDTFIATSSTGLFAQTNTITYLPPTQPAAAGSPARVLGHTPTNNPGFYNTPQSVACIYGLITRVADCNPNDPALKSVTLSGGSKAIAIVAAFDAPNAVTNFKIFSQAFGLRQGGLEVVYGTVGGHKPPAPSDDKTKGWLTEVDTDVQWAHAMAPDATILLVEAASNDVAALLYATKVATDNVAAKGGGEVSMSWTANLDQLRDYYNFNNQDLEAWENEVFLRTGIVSVAATGDTPTVQYPSSSTRVIAVGGTSVNRKDTGEFENESAWQCTGAGLRTDIVQVAPYQSNVTPQLTSRGVGDLAAIADPTHGVLVYVGKDDDGIQVDNGWSIYGGTSVAAPIIAGLINNAGHFYKSAEAQLTDVYKNVSSGKYTEIDTGQCGTMPSAALDCCDPKNSQDPCCDPTNPNKNSQACIAKTQQARAYRAKKGWNFCTGVGSPKGLGGL